MKSIALSNNSIVSFTLFSPIRKHIQDTKVKNICVIPGIGSLIWATVTELFDGPARAFGVAVNLGVNTTLIFLTTKYFPILISEVGPAITYWSFAVVSILMCLFIIFFLPETKGKSFGEIQGDIAKKTKEETEVAN